MAPKSNRKSNPESKRISKQNAKKSAPARQLTGTCQDSSHTFNGMSVARASRQGLAGFLSMKLDKGPRVCKVKAIPPDSSFQHKPMAAFLHRFRTVNDTLVPVRHQTPTTLDRASPDTLQDNFESPDTLVHDDRQTPNTFEHNRFDTLLPDMSGQAPPDVLQDNFQPPDMSVPVQYELVPILQQPQPNAFLNNFSQPETLVQPQYQPLLMFEDNLWPLNRHRQSSWIPFGNMNEAQGYPNAGAQVGLGYLRTTYGSGLNGAGEGYGALGANTGIYTADSRFVDSNIGGIMDRYMSDEWLEFA